MANRRSLPSRGKAAIGNALLLVASLYVGLLVTDALLYTFFIKHPPAPHDPGLYMDDPERGFSLTPGFQGFLRHRAGKTPVSVNTKGYRGPEWDLDRQLKIMVVGDSYTFGVPLTYQEGFVHKTQSRLSDDAAVLNLGVPGYGAPAIMKTIHRECEKIQPQHVFYMYYLNDSRDDNLDMFLYRVFDGYLAPTRNKEGRALSEDEIRRRIQAEQEASWSPLSSLRLISIRTFLSERGMHPRQLIERWFGGPFEKDRYLATDNKFYSQKNSAVVAELIEKMQMTAEACGARFTLVILPSYAEAYYGVIEPATEQILAALPEGIEVLDGRSRTQRSVNLTQWYDSHYSPLGTDLIADILVEYLVGRFPKHAKD